MPLKAGGEFALVKEHLEKALGLSGQPVKRGTMAHDHDVFMALTDSAMQQRDVEGIRQYAPRLEELARRDDHQFYLAIAHRAWGVAHRLTGEYAEAHTRLNAAMELFGALETRWQIGRTYYEMAELDQAQSNLAAAREHFEQARTAFEALRSAPDVEHTRAALSELHLT